ncbi:MAG: hypothetical protein ACU0C9_01975 [Paracoccaceae bacterium]
MNAAPQTRTRDSFAGYFGSVALALIASGWVAGLLVDQFSAVTGRAVNDVWQINIAAGLFLGTAAANPIGALISRTSFLRVLVKFFLGIAAGVATQVMVFMPFAGDGMSNFLFLLLTGLAVPASILIGWGRSLLERAGIAPIKFLSNFLFQILNWSDRLVFVSLMGISFVLYGLFASNIPKVLIVQGLVLAVVIYSVSRKQDAYEFADDPEAAAYQAWLALDPEQPDVDPMQDVVSRLKHIVFSILPGAILFAGMIRLTHEFLWMVYPDLLVHIDLQKPLELFQNIAIFTASGLAAIVIGMLLALGICMLNLRLVGALKNWSNAHLRDNYIHIIRLLYFRPIGKYWHTDPEMA